MTQTKADGLEVTPFLPMVSRFMRRLLHRANLIRTSAQGLAAENRVEASSRSPRPYEDEAFARLVQSLHMSFRQDIGDNGPYAQAFPRWPVSLRQMKRIQLITGQRPAVLYPSFRDGGIVYDEITAPFSERSFQPTPDAFHCLNLAERSSIPHVKRAMKDRGFTHITYDVYHSLNFEDPVALAQRLARAGLVRAMHLSLNRTEHDPLARSEKAQNTRFAKRQFVKSAEAARNTKEGEIFQVIAEQWKTNPLYDSVQTRVVLEDGPIGRRTRRDHAAIMTHAREIVASPWG